jgi:hypothetical protein
MLMDMIAVQSRLRYVSIKINFNTLNITRTKSDNTQTCTFIGITACFGLSLTYKMF